MTARPGGILARAARTFQWLAVAGLDRQPSVIETLAVTAGVTVVGLLLSAASLKIPADAVTHDMHSFFSLELAMNWVYCGKYSTHSVTYDLPHYLHDHEAEVRDRPLPAIVEGAAGTRDRYCADAQTFLNNENSLFYLFSALLAIHPNMTLRGLGVLLIWIRVAAIVFFVFALLSVGASPLLALLTLMIDVEIASLSLPTHLYSLYPFLLPFLGVYAGLLALTLHFGWHRKRRCVSLAALVIGLFAGLFYNLRSSYLPSIVGGFVMFLVVILFERIGGWRPTTSARWKAVGIAAAGFVIGGGLFSLVFTWPITRSGVTSNRTHHVVGHPLVLGLAVPQNALSKREGILWSDPVGLDLARRVDPGATYLGPTYERALLTYYARLWRRYPREMLGIYLAKWRLSTSDSAWFVDSKMSALAQRSLGPTRYLRSGISFTIALLLIAMAGVYAAVKYSAGAGILVATFAATGFVVTLESAIVMPFFYIQYQNAQLGVLFLINLVLYQLMVNAACWMMTGNAHAGGSRSAAATNGINAGVAVALEAPQPRRHRE